MNEVHIPVAVLTLMMSSSNDRFIRYHLSILMRLLVPALEYVFRLGLYYLYSLKYFIEYLFTNCSQAVVPIIRLDTNMFQRFSSLFRSWIIQTPVSTLWGFVLDPHCSHFDHRGSRLDPLHFERPDPRGSYLDPVPLRAPWACGCTRTRAFLNRITGSKDQAILSPSVLRSQDHRIKRSRRFRVAGS